MAQVIVELSGDERKVLEAYKKALDADKALRDSTGKTGAAGQKASNEFATAWLKAGKESASSVNMLLVEMRKTGPEGRKAAEELEKHFRKTGEHGRKSLDSVISKLKEIDPAAANVANNFRRKMQEASEGAGDSLFDSIRDASSASLPEIARLTDGVGGIGGKLFEIAGTGGAVGALLGGFKLIGDAITANHAKLVETRDMALSVATAQQDASSNLVGMAIVDQNEVLSKRLPELAAQLGVEDLAGLKAAYGAAFSASGGDVDAADKAIVAAASVSSANTGGIRANAGAALDLARATGIADPERNLALLGTARSLARVDDPESFAKTLSKTLSQFRNFMPEQDPAQLAKQGAAFFATLSQFATDATGEETKTAGIEYGKKLDELFDSLPQIAMEARDKLAKLDAANTLTPSQAVDLKDLQTKQAEFTPELNNELQLLRSTATARERRVETLQDKPSKERTQDESDELKRLEKDNKRLTKLQKAEFSQSDAAKLKELVDRTVFTEMEQVEKSRLQSLAEAASKTIDPDDFDLRRKIIQQTPALRDKLHEPNIGGTMFDGIFRAFSSGDSDVSKVYSESIGKVSLDKKDFDAQAVAAMSASPAMLTGYLKRSGVAASNMAKLGQPGDGLGVQFEENVSNLLADTRGEGFLNSTIDYVGEVMRPERLPGTHALSKAHASVLPLISRRDDLIGINKAAGGDPEIEAKIAALDEAIKAQEYAAAAYVQQLQDGRVQARPGEIQEALSYNESRRKTAVNPNAPNALGTDLGREVLERQAEQLRKLQQSQEESNRLMKQQNELLLQQTKAFKDSTSAMIAAVNRRPRNNGLSESELISLARQKPFPSYS